MDELKQNARCSRRILDDFIALADEQRLPQNSVLLETYSSLRSGLIIVRACSLNDATKTFAWAAESLEKQSCFARCLIPGKNLAGYRSGLALENLVADAFALDAATRQLGSAMPSQCRSGLKLHGSGS